MRFSVFAVATSLALAASSTGRAEPAGRVAPFSPLPPAPAGAKFFFVSQLLVVGGPPGMGNALNHAIEVQLARLPAVAVVMPPSAGNARRGKKFVRKLAVRSAKSAKGRRRGTGDTLAAAPIAPASTLVAASSSAAPALPDASGLHAARLSGWVIDGRLEVTASPAHLECVLKGVIATFPGHSIKATMGATITVDADNTQLEIAADQCVESAAPQVADSVRHYLATLR